MAFIDKNTINTSTSAHKIHCKKVSMAYFLLHLSPKAEFEIMLIPNELMLTNR